MFIEFIEQYSQFFKKCNWYDFHVADVYFELDRHIGGIEIIFVVVGLGFRWRWNYRKGQ